MKLNELQPEIGAVKGRMRVGRGIACGKGKTCGRGQKGQKARSGVAIKGFEGGQMPLFKRLPKRGFTNIFANEIVNVTLVQLQYGIDAKKLDAKKTITEDALVEAGVIRRKADGVKIVASGELTTKLDIQVTAASKGAIAAIEKAGGKFEAAPQTGVRKERAEKRAARLESAGKPAARKPTGVKPVTKKAAKKAAK